MTRRPLACLPFEPKPDTHQSKERGDEQPGSRRRIDARTIPDYANCGENKEHRCAKGKYQLRAHVAQPSPGLRQQPLLPPRRCTPFEQDLI